MMPRLPYRIQIPLGLVLAVLTTAILVTVLTARISAQTAREETLATLERTVVLLQAQVRPMLAADDTWRVFSLLRDTAPLIPGARSMQARVAILDAEGQVFAASDPSRLKTGELLLGQPPHDKWVPGPSGVIERIQTYREDGAIMLVEPIRSEDGQTTGFVFVEVEASVFAPKWLALAKPVLIAVLLAALILVPAGWLIGKRMARPVARIAMAIERMGTTEPGQLQARIPHTADPELSRIGNAVRQLAQAMAERSKAEARALSAQRLAAVGRMTAAVAHEINNPLGGLLTATQTLRLHGDSAEARQRTVDLLTRGLEQIRTTVAALLPQARVEDRALAPDDLDDVVTLVHAHAWHHTYTLNTHTEIESALRVSSATLRQVMLNLLLNAVKAAGDGGRVDALLKADGDRIQFSVTNTGAHMTVSRFEEILAQESNGDPRGFGLWVCHELANLANGKLVLDTGQNNGTRLTFDVPNRERRALQP